MKVFIVAAILLFSASANANYAYSAYYGAMAEKYHSEGCKNLLQNQFASAQTHFDYAALYAYYQEIYAPAGSITRAYAEHARTYTNAAATEAGVVIRDNSIWGSPIGNYTQPASEYRAMSMRYAAIAQ